MKAEQGRASERQIGAESESKVTWPPPCAHGAKRLQEAVVDFQLPGVDVQVGQPDGVGIGQVALRGGAP